MLSLRLASSALALSLLAACGSDDGGARTPTDPTPVDTSSTSTPGSTTRGATLGAVGLGAVSDRFTAEVWVRGNTAYTTTWGNRGGRVGNAVKIWDVSGSTPVLVDSVIVANASTLGDVQTSDDGKLLVVAIEPGNFGGLAIYNIESNPRRPQLIARTTGGPLAAGVHTAEVARVNGVLHVFAAVDPGQNAPARLVILSLADPANPTIVSTLVVGNPFIHDVYVRDGLLFTAEWFDGVAIYDIGAQGGHISQPRFISRLRTVGGQVHNMWWFHDPTTSDRKYLFVGQEGPGVVGSTSSGDIHVVDLSTLTKPVEVAAFNVPGAGVHNFSMDEANGFLYAAYYNGGVRVLDVRGDLGTCNVVQKLADGRCNLVAMNREQARFTGNGAVSTYIWGVHYQNGSLYASDMLQGLWKLQASAR